MPQNWLCGYVISFMQRRLSSQGSPKRTQIPQLELQQISPTSQVAVPQGTLDGRMGMPQISWSHFSPGMVQVPQLALQQTVPAGQTTAPH